MKAPQVVVCGSIALDRIMNFSGRYRDLIHIDKVHVLSLSVLLDKLEETPGGVGANIAYNLALLGERPVLLGAVGSNGRGLVKTLSKHGVNTEHVHFSKLPTASFNVITDKEDNQVGGFYPGAMSDSKAMSLKPWSNQEVMVIVSAHDPTAMSRQVSECQRYNLRLCYDPGQQVANVPAQDLRAGVAAAEILIGNDYELSMLCKRIGVTATALKSRVPVVVTTLGRVGSVIEGKSLPRPIKIAAAKAVNLVDPTGSGDGYRAGFLYGYLRKWDLQVSGRLAAVVASFVVEHHGTQQHRFSKQAITQRYRAIFKEDIVL